VPWSTGPSPTGDDFLDSEVDSAPALSWVAHLLRIEIVDQSSRSMVVIQPGPRGSVAAYAHLHGLTAEAAKSRLQRDPELRQEWQLARNENGSAPLTQSYSETAGPGGSSPGATLDGQANSPWLSCNKKKKKKKRAYITGSEGVANGNIANAATGICNRQHDRCDRCACEVYPRRRRRGPKVGSVAAPRSAAHCGRMALSCRCRTS
jgi:hypothetical protein